MPYNRGALDTCGLAGPALSWVHPMKSSILYHTPPRRQGVAGCNSLKVKIALLQACTRRLPQQGSSMPDLLPDILHFLGVT